jgi:hypothetical protein
VGLLPGLLDGISIFGVSNCLQTAKSSFSDTAGLFNVIQADAHHAKEEQQKAEKHAETHG